MPLHHHRSLVRRGPFMACAVFTLALSAWAAQAATYRCEVPSNQPGAKPEIRYQSQACEGGRALQTADHRTEAQRADTAKATQSTAKLGKELERERRHQEKKAAGQSPIAMDATKPKAKSADHRTQGQTLKRQRPFTAKVPKAKADAGTSSN